MGVKDSADSSPATISKKLSETIYNRFFCSRRRCSCVGELLLCIGLRRDEYSRIASASISLHTGNVQIFTWAVTN